LVALER